MITLNVRAQKIRAAAASALSDQQRDEIVRRAAGLVRKLDESAKDVLLARGTIDALAEVEVITDREAVPSSSHIKNLITQAEGRVDALPEFLQSGLPGDLELGLVEYCRSLDDAAKRAWARYAEEKVGSLGAASQLLEKALGSIPRFVPTIERVQLARGRLRLLKGRELPTAAEVREFHVHLETLEAANAELEREVPSAYQEALRRCATPAGLPPSELPDGFVAWIEKIGAGSYFKVTLSQ